MKPSSFLLFTVVIDPKTWNQGCCQSKQKTSLSKCQNSINFTLKLGMKDPVMFETRVYLYAQLYLYLTSCL